MDYEVIITERAEEHLDKIIEYIVLHLKNDFAALSVLDDVKKTYERLRLVAGSLQLCDDPYLAKKGYRKICLEKHDYLLLYQIRGDLVYVNGIFHMLENYRDKL